MFDSLVKNKNLHLYAKYEKDESVLIEEKDVTVLNNYNPIGDNNAEESQIVEEKIEINRALLEIGDLYDLIRYEMLSYERATPFKNLGVERKQVVAEMFEKDNKIHLYLAVDPDLMKEKGYKVEKYTELEFQIVPCKKIVENYADYEEAVKLIKEAMIINNFIKSDVSIANKIKSDETVRRSGFAFFVKNEVVVTCDPINS